MAAEKIFECKVKKYLNSLECCWFTKVWGGGFQKSGIPDLLCCVNGVFISIELKASNGTASELQKHNIKKINQAGGIGIILYPGGFEDFKKIILGVINCNTHTAALKVLKNAHSSTSCVILTK